MVFFPGFPSLSISFRVLSRLVLLGSFVLVPIIGPLIAQSETLLVSPEIQFQRMEGFGVSIGNGAAKEMDGMPGNARLRLLDLLFGSDGAHLNILRNEVWWTGKRLPFTSPLYLSGLPFSFSDEAQESAQILLVPRGSEAQ